MYRLAHCAASYELLDFQRTDFGQGSEWLYAEKVHQSTTIQCLCVELVTLDGVAIIVGFCVHVLEEYTSEST